MPDHTEKNVAAEDFVEGQSWLRKVVKRAVEVMTRSGPSERHQDEASAEEAKGESVKSDTPLAPMVTRGHS
jgi:DNA relaxase NicK